MSERELYQRIARLEYLVQNLYAHNGISAPTESAIESGGALSPEVQQEMAAGNTIGAIKRYREETGVGLAEAKAAIDGYFGR